MQAWDSKALVHTTSCNTDLHQSCQVANTKARTGMDWHCCQWAQQLTLCPGTALGSAPPELTCSQGLGPLSSKAVTPSMLQDSAIWVPGCTPALTLPAGSRSRVPHCVTSLACLDIGGHCACLHVWPHLQIAEALAPKHLYCAARQWLARLPQGTSLWAPHIWRAAPNSTHSMAHLKTAQS